MKDRKLAARYARALLSTLTDPGPAEAADRFLAGLRQALVDSDDLRAAMLDPSFSRESRKAILQRLARENGQPDEMVNFLAALVDNNRTAALPAIAKTYHEELQQRSGVISAEIATPLPLPDDLRDRARQSLERMTGRKVELTCSLDRALIGGAVTRIGSKVYDGSLRAQLEKLRGKMVQE